MATMASCTTDQLDEHICLEILKRLPVETLVRFRCVCKQWNSLISSSFFANHRLSFTFSSSDDSTKSYILFNSSKDSSSYTFYTPDDQDPHRLRFVRTPFEPQPIQDPSFPALRVIDVVHGVVCLSQRGLKYTYRTVLWNPALHKYVEIPLSGIDVLVAGFGFDSRNNDFKVVKFLAPGKQQLSFEVFSTQERRWRKVVAADHIGPCSPTYTDGGCFKNAAIHWIVRWCNEEVLLMFDCEREEFKTMKLPTELKAHDGRKVLLPFIACCTGMLSVLEIMVMGRRSYKLAVWVMEEYGVASSWRKLTRDQVDVVDIRDYGVLGLEIEHLSTSIWRRMRTINRSHQPFNGYVFEPSMFLMDEKSVA